jgi:hypothetical protein
MLQKDGGIIKLIKKSRIATNTKITHTHNDDDNIRKIIILNSLYCYKLITNI